MRAALALMRAGWLTAKSYRLSMVLSVISLAFTIVPVYYIARALRPVMASAIQTEGQDYVGFILIGLTMFSVLSTVLSAIPGAISGGIGSGFFEALLVTPTGLPSLIAGQ